MTGVAVRPAGDRAVLLELADNAAALRVAERLRAERPELVDVVPGHRTVLLTWGGGDRPPGLAELAEAALADELPGASRPAREIAVTYDGPDLEEVARLCGLSVEEVVARHRAAMYVVGFLGFAPGFAYLLGGDPALHVPRRDDPRTRVPAGSVAVAGPYSGIYPRESPGGWRLLGRTDAVLFDAAREPPALLAAGDGVRFVAR
jgi:KipI family sensor histidine kinase inhibitor